MPWWAALYAASPPVHWPYSSVLCVQLLKSLYGLKQASKAGLKKLSDLLKRYKFSASKEDKSLPYYRSYGGKSNSIYACICWWYHPRWQLSWCHFFMDGCLTTFSIKDRLTDFSLDTRSWLSQPKFTDGANSRSYSGAQLILFRGTDTSEAKACYLCTSCYSSREKKYALWGWIPCILGIKLC